MQINKYLNRYYPLHPSYLTGTNYINACTNGRYGYNYVIFLTKDMAMTQMITPLYHGAMKFYICLCMYELEAPQWLSKIVELYIINFEVK